MGNEKGISNSKGASMRVVRLNQNEQRLGGPRWVCCERPGWLAVFPLGVHLVRIAAVLLRVVVVLVRVVAVIV